LKLLLTHVPQARAQYYGARALARLQGLVDVVLHEGAAPLDAGGLIAAAQDVDFTAHRRPDPARERKPGFRHGATGRSPRKRRDAARCGQSQGLDASRLIPSP
jgi:hypothetical protein